MDFRVVNSRNVRNTGTRQKSEAILKELSNKLTEKKRQKWLNKILLEDKLDFEKLDGLLEV